MSVATATVPPGSPTPTAEASPTAGFPTGIDSVDAIADVADAGDARALEDLVLFRQVACTTTIEGIGGPPRCREGEAEGTEVLAVFGASCEGFFAREDELRFQGIALSDPPIYGVFRMEGSRAAAIWPDAKYAVVLSRVSPNGPLAFTLFADDEGIVGFSLGCGEAPARYVEAQEFVRVIVAPAE